MYEELTRRCLNCGGEYDENEDPEFCCHCRPEPKRPNVRGGKETDNSHDIRITTKYGMVCFSFGTLEAHCTGQTYNGTVHLNEEETRNLFETMAKYYKVDLKSQS